MLIYLRKENECLSHYSNSLTHLLHVMDGGLTSQAYELEYEL